MKFEVLLLLLLFSLVEAQDHKVIGSHEPVHVRVGEDVILPCHLKPPFDVNRLTVEWRWNEKYVYIHRSNKPDLVNQDKIFKDRTSLFPEEMKKGNISLKVTNVTEVHAGNYTCFVPQLHSQVRKDKVILIVDPVEKNKDENQIKGGHTGIGTAGIIGIVAAVLLIGGIVGGTLSWCKKKQPNQPNEGNVPSLEGEELKNLNNEPNRSNTTGEQIEMDERRTLNTDGDIADSDQVL